MVEPEVIALLGPALLVHKLLGPTADYLGEGIRDWTERATRNVREVLLNAERKLGPELEEPGTVPPRVLKGVLEEAQFSEDELATEYLGGVLASARTPGGRDDRGATLTALIGRLSSYQLRLHYVLYAAARPHLVGKAVELGNVNDRREKAHFFMPLAEALIPALALSGEEKADFGSIFHHCIFGLEHEALLENFSSGSPDLLRSRYRNLDWPSAGLLYGLAPLGIELFVRVHGKRGVAFDRYLDLNENFDVMAGVSLGPGATLDVRPPAVSKGRRPTAVVGSLAKDGALRSGVFRRHGRDAVPCWTQRCSLLDAALSSTSPRRGVGRCMAVRSRAQ